MTPDQEMELFEKINNIHTLLAGSEYDEDSGLVKRVQKVETYIAKDEALKMKIAGGMAVGTPIFVVMWDYIKRKFNIF